ncbi:MAG: hypothetical protein JNK58_03395 [Phycisphaerae bacterium]|nr:hypothetical protein [Phycisphaerae bacterium]
MITDHHSSGTMGSDGYKASAFPPAHLRRFEAVHVRLDAERTRLLGRLDWHLARGDHAEIPALVHRLSCVAFGRRLLSHLRPSAIKGGERYLFSSAMLRDSFTVCNETRDEGMHFILGIESDATLIGTEIVTFPYSHRSPGGAAGEHGATHRICVDAIESGHRLLAIVHSHPGSGPEANHPSSIDLRTQRLWEPGFGCIGGIWSRSGELRWFSAELEFEVEIKGTHLGPIGPNHWRLNTTCG